MPKFVGWDKFESNMNNMFTTEFVPAAIFVGSWTAGGRMYWAGRTSVKAGQAAITSGLNRKVFGLIQGRISTKKVLSGAKLVNRGLTQKARAKKSMLLGYGQLKFRNRLF